MDMAKLNSMIIVKNKYYLTEVLDVNPLIKVKWNHVRKRGCIYAKSKITNDTWVTKETDK
jgi:hypothetical protein